jgi:hypothetical protein
MSENNIILYDCIEKAPIERYLKHNNFMAMAAETGENWEDLTTRIKRSNGYIASDDKQSAFKENSNLLMAFSFIKNEFSPSAMAYAVMVKSIDGIPCDDISESGLLETIKKVSALGVSFEDIKTDNERVKKKYLTSLLSTLKKLFRGLI